MTHVNRRPSKYGTNNAFIRMNIHAFRRGNHVIGTAISSQVDKAIAGDVMYEP